MEDTSFAIHPGAKKKIAGTAFRDIGNLISYSLSENKSFIGKCEAGMIQILFYRDDIVRIMMDHKKEPTLSSSHAVIAEPEKVDLRVHDEDSYITIQSPLLTLFLYKNPCRIKAVDKDGRTMVSEKEKGMGHSPGGEVICYKEMDREDHFYGFGEKTSFLDKRGEKMTMWNSDVFAPHNPEIDALYESIPYFMTVNQGKAYGIFFDNTYKTTFDMKTYKETYSFSAEGGLINYYLMAGPEPKDVITQYSYLTGRMPLPPKWAIGYHQSRYSYETEEEVRELVKNFKEKQIPLDAVYLDIHYMNGYRVFTFDEERYPDPGKLMNDLKKEGIHVVPIVDPGVKTDPEYPSYLEGVKGDHFCKYVDGKMYNGDVWPGNSAFPDFTNEKTRKWWGDKHDFYVDKGIEGIWNDMNEPAVFNETKTMDTEVMHGNDGDPKTHRELHNVYGLLMGKATYEGMKAQLKGKRPFLLTRAGYSGVQRYAAVWTGDNRSFWEHLQMALPMCMNLGVSGVPFCGPDVGGFAHDATGQLLARWTQVGAFTPFFRNHSALDTVRQEPWSFGEEIEDIVKKYIDLRYVWMPHLYTLFKEASTTGIPVMRPLFLEYPEDKETTNLSDEFMIGDSVIVAPILQPDKNHRAVYLPEGSWIDYWTGEEYRGSDYHLVKAPLDRLPIFIKKGAIIALGEKKMSTEQKEEKITFHIYPSSNGGEYYFYEDDGSTFNYREGKMYEGVLRYQIIGNVIDLTFETKVNAYEPDLEKEVVIHSGDEELTLRINGEEKGNTDGRSRMIKASLL
ncbi:glycoside hydrolase family 31 protein [Thalassorhabdus alkalitolerans]|uniref:Glycoside hydrolase family 31 protein n=1 Tax=Thalassorhabdus alkalitolerans TaxID=2282697 RepID=A0ABW0YP74_9BACI